MKIILINSVSGFGSTGRIVEDIAKYMRSNGHECYIAYSHCNSMFNGTFKYGSFVEHKKYAVHTRLLGQQGLYAEKGTKQLINYLERLNPDIIHLHNIHGNHLHFPLLFSFLKKTGKAVFWTLHDCWSYTGGCAYYTNYNCFKWKNEGCRKFCPHYHAWLPDFGKDRVNEIFELKKKYFTGLKKFNIITVSDWLKKDVEQSFFQGKQITRQYNWIDCELFKPTEGFDKRKYNIPEDKKIVLCVSAYWGKHSVRYKHALELAKKLPSSMCLVVVGKLTEGATMPESIYHIPYLNEIDELVKIFSAADVYVHLSVEDTFGKVVAEAMACGTPVIVFNSTALPELVKNNCGYIVEKNNLDEIIFKIEEIAQKGKKYYSDFCIVNVKSRFDYNPILSELMKMYKQSLK